jgi:cephalosporin hydroxylase
MNENLSKNRFSNLNIETNQLYGLNELIIDFLGKDSVVCEVGSFKGVSTELFAKKCKKVFCVDITCTEKLREIIDKYNIVFIKKDSLLASKLFNNNFFDCVYLDDKHTYEHVYKELKAWWPKVKYGGILAGHDYLSIDIIKSISKWGIDLSYNWTENPTVNKKIKKGQGVKFAVDSFFKNKKIHLYKDSSWAKKKQNIL